MSPGVRSATASGSIAALRWNASHSVVGCWEVVFESLTQRRLVPEYLAGMRISVTDFTPVERTAFVTDTPARSTDVGPGRYSATRLADEIVAKIDYHFQGLGVPSSVVRQTALRAKMLDDRLRTFISQHPDAVVVALGAGLDPGMLRVQARRPRWTGTTSICHASSRCATNWCPRTTMPHSVAASLADDGWTDQIPSNRPTMLIADGLLAFLPSR